MVDVSSASRPSISPTQQAQRTQQLEQQRQQTEMVQQVRATPEEPQQNTFERGGSPAAAQLQRAEPPQPAAPNHATGFAQGLWGGVTDLASGLYDMGHGAVNLTGLNGEAAQRQTQETISRTAQTVWNNPGSVVEAVTRPVTEPWSQGRYGEAIGRGVFEVGSAILGAKGLDKLARGGTVARGLDTAADAGRTADRAGDAARVTETAAEAARVTTTNAGVRAAVQGLDAVAAREALTNMRGGGGHAVRHLQEQGLIPNNGSLASRVEASRAIAEPVLQNPTHRFPWRQGNTPGEIFLGEHNGRQVAVHVANEGPHAGKVTSMYAVDERNLAAWRHLMQ